MPQGFQEVSGCVVRSSGETEETQLSLASPQPPVVPRLPHCRRKEGCFFRLWDGQAKASGTADVAVLAMMDGSGWSCCSNLFPIWTAALPTIHLVRATNHCGQPDLGIREAPEERGPGLGSRPVGLVRQCTGTPFKVLLCPTRPASC